MRDNAPSLVRNSARRTIQSILSATRWGRASFIYNTLLSAALLGAGATPSLHAQAPTGRITGRIVDAASGAPITDVAVKIAGTTIGGMSGLEGRFSILRVPAGTTTLEVRRIGYQAKTITGLLVPENGVIEQDVSLVSSAAQLAATVVTASAERGSVNKALDEQRSSNAILSTTTAEQISKSPDSDAAQAVKRVSGVTVQDGKYVFVRGLGERYTQTSLNGARVPSPEPEKKMVPLDLFPAGLLDAITTSKTFTPDQPGDFSGALVDIRTKDFPGRRQFGATVSGGFNAGASAQQVLVAPRTGSEWLGFAGSSRSLPDGVRSAGGLREVQPGAQTNALLRSFRNSWSPSRDASQPNAAFGLSYGGEDELRGHRLGYVGSLSYQTTQEVRLGEALASPRADGNGGAEALNSYEGATGRNSVLWGGLLNLSTWLGQKSRLTLSNTYNRTSDNEAQSLTGRNEEYARTFQTSRLSFVQRSVLSNQLRGEHVVGSRHTISWNASRSEVSRDEPDRADLNYWQQGAGFVWKGGANDATRTFSALTERDAAGAVNYRVLLGNEGYNRALKVGAYTRNLRRNSDVRSYDIVNLRLDDAQLGLPAEQLFDGRYFTSSDTNVLIRPSTFGGQYHATEHLAAGYAMVELPFASRLKLVGGARVERSDINVGSLTAQGLDTTSRLRNTDLLPSVSMTFSLTESQNLRVSATQTLSRPEYRELSPVAYLDVGGTNEERGNPGLRRALIQNYDLRWEMYPNSGEVISLAAFVKRFSSPIERVLVATTGKPQTGFTNAESANNYGVELDLRKNLGSFSDRLRPLTFFTNATVMRSRISITDEATAATNPERAMVGQAPFVVNTGLSFANLSGRLNANLLYNVVGKRIIVAGVQPIPDTYEMPRNIVDFALQFPILSNVSGKVAAQNLLNAAYEERTGALVRRRFELGRSFSAGLSLRR